MVIEFNIRLRKFIPGYFDRGFFCPFVTTCPVVSDLLANPVALIAGLPTQRGYQLRLRHTSILRRSLWQRRSG